MKSQGIRRKSPTHRIGLHSGDSILGRAATKSTKSAGTGIIFRHGGIEIHFDDDKLVSLTDLWKAAGSPKSRTPNEYTRQKGADSLVEHVAENYGLTVEQVLIVQHGGSSKNCRCRNSCNDSDGEKNQNGNSRFGRKERKGWYEAIGNNGDGESTGKKRCMVACNGGRSGTWAHWEIAVAYARWISPEFHSATNKALREWAEEKKSPGLKVERGIDGMATNG